MKLARRPTSHFGLVLILLHTLPVHSKKSGPPPDPQEILQNERITDWFFWTWASVISALMIFTFVVKAHRYLRLVSCIADDRQTFFSYRAPLWGFVRKHLIDSPLIRTRHHKEFQINSVVNMGTLPSRFQTIFLVLYFVFQLVFLVYGINLSDPKKAVLGKLLSRTGILAVSNMLPLFLLAARNNPFIRLCDISFDTFNLIHRWMGRMAAFMAIIHTSLWMARKVLTSPATGWAEIGEAIQTSEFIKTGFIAFICFSVLLLSSPSALRHAFYETFLHIHIAAAAISLGALWFHLKEFRTMGKVLRVVIGIWVVERSLRLLRILFFNVGGSRALTRGKVQVLPGEAVRVTCTLSRSWNFTPGQHAYVYIPAVGLWSSHPLSVAWADAEEELDGVGTPVSVTSGESAEKGLPRTVSPCATVKTKQISFLCRRRTGFTDALYRKALTGQNGEIEVTALLEGPYGNQDLRSFGTVILLAAGVGITHQLPHVRDLVAAYSTGACATRRVLLVWSIREQEQLEWVRTWMTEILGMPQRREVLRVQLYVTRPVRAQEIHSPSASVQMFPGRPNLQFIISKEVENAVGAVGVSCCGIGDMADQVRKACREHMGDKSVAFMEESFTW